MSDIVLFAAFPYVAVVLAVFGGVYRYRINRFSYSTLSSQLLENRTSVLGLGAVALRHRHRFAGAPVRVPYARHVGGHDSYAGSPVYDRDSGLRVRAGRADRAVRTVRAPPLL